MKKKRKGARGRGCPRLRHRKTKGEWAELVFMTKAMSLGFTVCRPYGDNHRFDFLVYAAGSKVSRVQVKSSWGKTDNMYRFKCSATGRRRYKKGEVDFIVVYVVPEDAWYVIPRRKAARYDVGYVMPHIKGSRAQWERYREAWELLRDEVPGVGIELRACADTFNRRERRARREKGRRAHHGGRRGARRKTQSHRGWSRPTLAKSKPRPKGRGYQGRGYQGRGYQGRG